MRALALVAVLAACSTPSSTPAPPSHTKPAPTSPQPVVRFADLQLDATGLPAIAADGSVVVHTEIDGDGGRGNPNLAIIVRDRADREVERIVVVTANESEGQIDERGTSAALATKIAAANTRLGQLHSAHDLRPLVKLAGEGNPLAADEGSHAQGQGLIVDFGAKRLTIRAGDRALADLAPPASWVPADKPMCRTCDEVCHHAPYLAAAHADVAHTLVLLTVAYSGTDLCPEPVSQHHVLVW